MYESKPEPSSREQMVQEMEHGLRAQTSGLALQAYQAFCTTLTGRTEGSNGVFISSEERAMIQAAMRHLTRLFYEGN